MDRLAMTIDEVNALGFGDFVQSLGGITEDSPWVAERAAALRPFRSRVTMIEAFCCAIEKADRDQKLSLLRAHPDLATRAKLTADSSREQCGAGLDSLRAEEFARFTELNTRYRERFGFPFVFAVKGATKDQILQSFEERVGNSPEAEFATALANVCRIVRFRIEDRVEP
ncbi:MAG: 2-oxo-4-hydroxy-4-carboxy-5-ureidoimidazoline decarboxylase [Hyphomicrobiales bacterium]